MTERDKIVQKLEEVIAEAVYPDRPRKFMMSLELAEAALALLKEQEPRVMTVDEIKQLSNGDTVWIEISDGRLLPMMVEDGILMRCGYMWRICDEAFCAHEEGECAARAWTSRPTYAQREAVPWD